MAAALAAVGSNLLGPIANVLQLAVVLNFIKDLIGTFTGGGSSSDALDKLIEMQLVTKMLGSLGGGGGGGVDLGGLLAAFMPMLMMILLFALLPRFLGK